MKSKGIEYRVGLFAIAGIAAALLSVFLLSPDLFDETKKIQYYTLLEDASGILTKTHVKTNGVNIGSVSAITLTENSTRIDIDIEENITIPAGSTAVVRSVGFLGDKFIEIVRAKGSNEVIKPGGLIPPSTDSKDINEIIGIMGGIATDIKKVTNNLAFRFRF